MIHIVVPAFEEEGTVGLLLWKIRRLMAEFGRDYRIYVADDASTDGTSEVLERYRRLLPLRILKNEERMGYARTLEALLRTAVDEAEYPKRDVVVTLQADFSEDPADIVPMIKAVEGGADLVAGAPQEGRGPVPRRVRLTRWIATRLLGWPPAGASAGDPLCGLRAYRVIVVKKALREMGDKPLLTAHGWAANVQLLERLAPHARRVKEEPTNLRYDLHPRTSRHAVLRTLKDVLALRGSLSWGHEGKAA